MSIALFFLTAMKISFGKWLYRFRLYSFSIKVQGYRFKISSYRRYLLWRSQKETNLLKAGRRGDGETGRVEDFSPKTLRLQTSDFSQPPYLHKKRARRLFLFPISPHMPRRKDEAECHHARRHKCHSIIMALRPPEGKRGEDRKEKKFDGIRHKGSKE